VIWWGFVLISAFVSLIAYEVLTENNIYYSIGYVLLGFTISLAQFDVAGHNYYNTQSFFTRSLWKIYSNFNK